MRHVIIDGFHFTHTNGRVLGCGCWRGNGNGTRNGYTSEEWEMGTAMVVCLTSVACNAAHKQTSNCISNMHPLKNN